MSMIDDTDDRVALEEELANILENRSDTTLDAMGESFADDATCGGPPVAGPTSYYRHHACNPATMVCLRGPCQHYWELQRRFQSAGDDLAFSCIRTCTYGAQESGLSDENVYECDRWWPRPLSAVPEVVRTFVRKALTEYYEKKLVAQGHDFSWKTSKKLPTEPNKPITHGLSPDAR